MLVFDRKKFWAAFRLWFRKTHGVPVSQETVDGLEFVLNCIALDPEWKDLRFVANFLAQTGHESEWKWKPVKERRSRKAKARANQDRYWHTGYYGRGIIQLTWEKNYLKFKKLLGIDLIGHPELALDPMVSYRIASVGMRRGLFTGAKLSDFLNSYQTDYKGSRKIVNGTDRDDDIKNYSHGIENILRKSVMSELTQLKLTSLKVERPVVSVTEVHKQEPENSQIEEQQNSSSIEPEAQSFDINEPVLIDDEIPPENEPQPEEKALTESEIQEAKSELIAEENKALEPQDNYPDSPKAGEAAPEQPAQEGQPVVGGRPGDKAFKVEATVAEKPSGWKTWKTTVAGWWATLGISVTTLGSYFWGAAKDPTAGKVLIILGSSSLVAAIFIGITYLIIRAVLLVKRERMAHEMTLKEMTIRASSTMYNVTTDRKVFSVDK